MTGQQRPEPIKQERQVNDTRNTDGLIVSKRLVIDYPNEMVWFVNYWCNLDQNNYGKTIFFKKNRFFGCLECQTMLTRLLCLKHTMICFVKSFASEIKIN